MKPTPFACRIVLFLLFCTSTLCAQDSLRYYRLYLHDKGIPARVLLPGDPFYTLATEHLTERALTRRAKVLPADQLVTTNDLPIHAPYLEAIAATGATIAQTSRWLNTVMVIADSAQYERITSLSFLDSLLIVGTRRSGNGTPYGKRLILGPDIHAAGAAPAENVSGCITDLYGHSSWQNRMMGIDRAHQLGIAGDGVLIGVLDAGFDWRGHAALRDLKVIAEHDFVFGDDNTFDEEGELGAESHGTAVMSMIGGYLKGTLVGGAPQASFILAKTEDIRMERQVEEDNFVAGLEWMEAMGVDVTNTSLGYTQFDYPDRPHEYSELNGHTAQASRGLNHAVGLGVVCVVAAGNEAGRYNYVSVPAEADSAIAVAAVDSTGSVARFSSRGFGGRIPVKPDVAGFGVGNWGADYTDTFRLTTGQGTSYASPMVTGVVALLLSARPSLTPYQIRAILQSTASRAADPDTAVGYGVVNAGAALAALSRTAPIVGRPKMSLMDDHLAIAAGTLYEGGRIAAEQRSAPLPTLYLSLTVRDLASGRYTTLTTQQPLSGLARWYLPAAIGDVPVLPGTRLELTISAIPGGAMIRRDTLVVQPYVRLQAGISDGSDLETSTICATLDRAPVTMVATAVPNPFRHFSVIEFQTESRANVSLAVYNTLGEEMIRLIDTQEMDPGFHTSLFQPAGLPTGAYYYMLRVGDAVSSDQMIYVP